MDHDVTDVAEARYELVISVDARRSGEYDDIEKTRMRARIYRVLETAFTHTKVARDSLHMEDRGDGVLVSVSGQVPVARLLGLWMVEVHEKLRDENRALRVPLGLRVGMHVGPVRHDDRGIAGRAVDLACRLADSTVARQVLDAERADLVLVVSGSLYEDVVSGGGKFIEPARYSAARLELKEGPVTAWFHLPGRPAPAMPVAPGTRPDAADMSDVDDVNDADDADRTFDPGEAGEAGDVSARYHVQGDMSQHTGNVYQQPVHIGRTTGDAGRRKG
ncbi:hypothetical protein AMK09_21105 [Streptomyces sp. CB02488]|uniref:hypothetical protein n=1 Tax=Streptomyces sp. CB02488 TaxID=1703920 RepID=UPI0009401C6E|nr:hypothetical protein [Streptomyces sp. CB02488]OKK17062.1 hypothetical protein AMK09_21105 [Streptomyces sp. CB02488]